MRGFWGGSGFGDFVGMSSWGFGGWARDFGSGDGCLSGALLSCVGCQIASVWYSWPAAKFLIKQRAGHCLNCQVDSRMRLTPVVLVHDSL